MSSGDYRSRVEQAMHAVPRDRFVPVSQRRHAFDDTALPIGHNQTISQPSLVAFMTEELHLRPESRVLEVGTGSGYQAAILAQLAADVFTIERVRELSVAAEERLKALGYRNIHLRIGDGSLGWPEAAPFDAIIVTAAAEAMPPALLEQLKAGGRLLGPIGSVAADDQELVLAEKNHAGDITFRRLGAVRFVPLVSGAEPEP